MIKQYFLSVLFSYSFLLSAADYGPGSTADQEAPELQSQDILNHLTRVVCDPDELFHYIKNVAIEDELKAAEAWNDYL